MNKLDKFLCSQFPKGSYNHALKKFLKKRSAKISPHTIARLYYNLHPIGQATDNPQIDTLTADWLITYIDQLWLKYAPDTMRTTIADIRLFFKWCKKKKHHSKNITKRIRPIRRRRSRRKKAAPEESIQQLIQHLSAQLTRHNLIYRNVFNDIDIADPADWPPAMQRTLRDLFIITFLYETGARVGELCKLGSKALNDSTRHPATAYQITLIGKTNDRDYFFTEKTAELWRMWQQVRPQQRSAYAVVSWRQSRPVMPMKPNGVSQMLVRHCKALKIDPFRSHALRHAKIKRSRKAVGIEMAKLLVDHSNLETTWGYANIDDDELMQATVETGLKIDLWRLAVLRR